MKKGIKPEAIRERVAGSGTTMKIVSSNLCEIFEVGKIGANLPNWI
jgi:hypothetical protein